LQEEANHGPPLSWHDPELTTRQLALDIFHWPEHELQTRLLDNDKTTAHVRLICQQPRMEINVTLTRLTRTTTPGQTGIWFVTDAHTQNITLVQPASPASPNSPLTLRGHIQQGETRRKLQTQLFDHTFSAIGKTGEPKVALQHNGDYTVTIQHTGRPILLLIENMPAAISQAAGQLVLVRLPPILPATP
jgi:hypothetical protein